MQGLIARTEVSINVSRTRVWQALLDPAAVREYMFGTQVRSDWKEGSSITWKGEWKGKAYEDKGVLQKVAPEQLLEYTHFSPLSGAEDRPENYHTVTIELSGDRPTRVVLTQDNNPTDAAVQHSEANWSTMLASLKKFLER